MGVHEAADGVLTRMEADRLRARALQLVAELDETAASCIASRDFTELLRWAGKTQSVLKEVARG